MHRRVLPLLSCAIVLAALPLSTAVGQSDGTARLSLDDCLRIALQNNLDLVSARKNPLIAAQQVEVNKAPFDGVLSAGGNYDTTDGTEDITDNVSGAEGRGDQQTDVTRGDVAFSHLLQFGANYSLTYNLSDIDASSTSIQAATGFLTESQFTQTNDGFTLNYAMPLLKGFGKEVNTVNILLAAGDLAVSKEELRTQALVTLQSVEDAYWDLLAAQAAVGVSKESLHRAEALLELNKKKVEVGTLAPIEITEAEAGVASNVESVIVAETAKENAEDVLLQLMAAPDSSPMWGQSLELTDEPSYERVEVDLAAATETALAHRPEIATARQNLKDSELSERVAKRNVRHALDLTATYSPAAMSDTDRLLRTIQPPGIPDSDTTTNGDSDNWTIGLRYSYPLRNRSAKANYAIAKINAEKSDVALQSAEQAIRVDVRRSVRETESGIQRVEAARKNVELQKKKLEAEQKKFDNGMSTSFEVLTFQNDLADAQLAQIRAALDYLKALTALERSKGTLIEARGMALE